MSHHSSKSLTTADELRKLIESEAGPTLKYPRGRLCENDEGEIQIKIAGDPTTRTVIIDFGKPVAFIGFTPEQAHEIAACLIENANKCKGVSA